MKEKMAPVRVHSVLKTDLRKILSLDGVWDFTLDRENVGKAENWQQDTKKFDDTILVPGCLEGQGKGVSYIEPQRPNWAGTSDVPYFGTSWYQKKFTAPKKAENCLYELRFGGVSTSCEVYLNGEMLGSHEYGIIPFAYDVSDVIRFGEENTLTIRVENNHRHGTTPTSHHGFGSSTTELKWSGVYRSVELVTLPCAHLKDMQLIWDGETLSCVYTHSAKGGKVVLTACEKGESEVKYTAQAPLGEKIEMPMPGAKLWDDLAPNLYDITLTLQDENGNPVDAMAERFGLKVLSFENGRIFVNGRAVYLRGDMVHFHWPVTVSPPTDREDIRKKLKVYKDFGMNFLRHHTHSPRRNIWISATNWVFTP